MKEKEKEGRGRGREQRKGEGYIKRSKWARQRGSVSLEGLGGKWVRKKNNTRIDKGRIEKKRREEDEVWAMQSFDLRLSWLV